MTLAATLVVASTADAVRIANVFASLDPGNSPDLFDDVGSEAAQRRSTIAILDASATQFTSRYQATVSTDAGTTGAISNVVLLSAAYRIHFEIVDAAPATPWRLDVFTTRVGARTGVSDGAGNSAFALSAVTGSVVGPGTLTGTLGLAAIPRSEQTNNVNLAFNQQNGVAAIDGVGNVDLDLVFAFTATAETLVTSNQGDEAAVRLGIDAMLSSFTAGDYPGVGNRSAADDGHFVSVTLHGVPEPDTAALLAVGLAMLGGRRRGKIEMARREGLASRESAARRRLEPPSHATGRARTKCA